MSLPKIVESDPWLEEDDDFPSKKINKSNSVILGLDQSNLATMVKSGVYIYATIGILSKTNLSKYIIQLLQILIKSNRACTSLIIPVLITIYSLLHKKFLN